MYVYEYFKKKMFLHKNIEKTELDDADLLKLFREEIAEEISVKNKKEFEKNNLKEDLLWKIKIQK